MLELTDSNFQKEVIEESKLPVVVDFWAEWCGPCKMSMPIFEELEKEFDGKIMMGEMNVDANVSTPSRLGVMSLPTLAAFKNGKEIKRQVGFQGKEGYTKFLEEIL
ncbi:MAG: thioredoxin [bacterium]|nr:thioredoxin [bacterium]